MQSPPQEPQPPTGAAPEEPAAAPCQRCGAALAPGQDWCLECGAARQGRSRRGRDAARAATTIAATVALLVAGAGAASYAALTDDAATPVATTASPVAVAAAPAAPTQPTTTAQATATTTAATTTATPKLPPTATTATLPPVPKSPKSPKSPMPTPTTTTKTTSTKTTETNDKKREGPVVVALGPEAASVYDPYKRAIDQTDPADSYDDDAKTAFTLSTAPGPATMGIGLDYNLVNARAVRSVEIKTTTAGFSVEVYGAEAGRPADILAPEWKHLADASAVASKASDKGAVTIEFTPGRYRHVLLWFTTPPPAGPALAITEVRLLD